MIAKERNRANNEFAVERAAGIDMVPLESFDFQLNVSEQAAIPARNSDS